MLPKYYLLGFDEVPAVDPGYHPLGRARRSVFWFDHGSNIPRARA